MNFSLVLNNTCTLSPVVYAQDRVGGTIENPGTPSTVLGTYSSSLGDFTDGTWWLWFDAAAAMWKVSSAQDVEGETWWEGPPGAGGGDASGTFDPREEATGQLTSALSGSDYILTWTGITASDVTHRCRIRTLNGEERPYIGREGVVSTHKLYLKGNPTVDFSSWHVFFLLKCN